MRSEIICTYALCGFANFSSLGIVIGGLCGYFAIVSPFDVILSLMTSDQIVFSPKKPPYARPEEVTSHLWCWEPWSLALVCLLSTLALQVRDFSMNLFACLVLPPPTPPTPNASKITTAILSSWTCFQLNFFSKGSCFFLLWTVWSCSPQDLPSTPLIQIWWLAVQTFSKSKTLSH